MDNEREIKLMFPRRGNAIKRQQWLENGCEEDTVGVACGQWEVLGMSLGEQATLPCPGVCVWGGKLCVCGELTESHP